MNRFDCILLIISGIILMAHHYIVAGLVFDVSDPIGHDWLGFGFILIGAYFLYRRGQRR